MTNTSRNMQSYNCLYEVIIISGLYCKSCVIVFGTAIPETLKPPAQPP